MKKILVLLLVSVLLTGCSGKDPVMTKFQNEMTTFSQNVTAIHNNINSFSTTVTQENIETSKKSFLEQLDSLEDEFKRLANIQFPEEFAYLEKTADEADEYMKEAVESYHRLYEEYYTENLDAYAKENYERAWKRIKIIISLLHGETPSDVELVIQ